MKTAICLLLACTVGCSGYQHRFTTPPGFDGIDTIAVDIFKNRTLYMDIAEEFALELAREINSKTDLRIEDRGSSDAVITGSIDSYTRKVLREFENDDVSRYAIIITVSYQVVRLPSQGQPEQVIASGDRLFYSSEYEVASNRTEQDARAEAARRAAREVVSHIFETWEGKE